VTLRAECSRPARKRGVRDDGLLARAVDTMAALNDRASAAARAAGASAMTDVTGFGLLAAAAPEAAPSLGGPVRRDRRRGARRRRGAVMALQRPPGAARARWPIRSSKPAGRGTPRWKVRLLRRSV
jgi:hypothetical protein